MITKDNLRSLLNCLGFVRSEDVIQDVLTLHLTNQETSVSVDFTNEKIIYPDSIEADRDTTKNFSHNENFVVLECVVGLLLQGYKPEHIVLEPETPGGRENTNFYCDILIRDNDQRPYMLIECKTMDGKEDDEFSKAWKKTLQDGGQLFNYYNTYRQAQYLALYASDFVEDEPRCSYRLITMIDNKEYLESNPSLLSFEKVSSDNGTRDDFFKVWSETYGKDYATNGAFEVDDVPAFGVTKKKMTIDDLIIVDGQDIQKKYHQFAQTLRQYNVASHENAFDKLVNLFLVKVVDEVRNPKDLQFLWKGAAYDDYYSFQDRLQKLYQIGMKDYLGEDVTYIDNASIENAFRMQRGDPDAIKDTILEYFRQLKFYSNSDFGFLDVHNKQLFVQNAVILKAMVEMLQDMRLKTNQQNQFLGDLFEGFLDQGVKQNEGQFFTPTPITRFMVGSLPLEKIISESTDIPKAIDYACGAGHFLNEYASQIKPFVEQYKGEQSLPDYYKQIYGIEKEYRLSKVSKVSSFMYGQDGIQIVYGDALIPHEHIREGQFNVLVANPPYSVTGFLATLSKEQRQSYSLNSEVKDDQIETNNSIETFFIERAKQLLAPDGVAAIILPSSILTNSTNLYIRTREIILQYFDIVSISEFSSGTFGKTGTNTVVLFLRRKKSEPELADHYRNRVNAWFGGNHGQDPRYEDADAIERYAGHIGVPYIDYMTLVDGTPSEALMQNEIFSAYYEKFSDDTEAKKIKKKRVNARYSQAQKNADIQKYIFDSIRSIEKEKLYFFMLCESNPQPVIVVKSPTKTADTKQFLGYEWSSRKGSEGIKYLGAVVEEEDNDISANKGISQIQTPLFDPQNLGNEVKINTLIRKNYLGEDIELPEELSDYVDMYQLTDMLDFKRVDFDKAIKTTPILVYPKIECKADTPTEKLSVVAPYVTKSIKISSISVADYISTDNMLQNRAGIVAYEGTPNIDSITEFRKGDILVSNIRPYLKKIWLADRDGGCSKDVLVFRNSKPETVSNDYLKFILSTDTFFDFMMVGKTGVKMPRGDKKIIPNFEIPMPHMNVQEKIAEECAKVDKEIVEALKIIEQESMTLSTKIESLSGIESKVSSVCDINLLSKDPTNSPDDDFIYIDIDAVENGTGKINLKKEIKGKMAPSRARRYADSNSTIISTVRPYLRGFAFVEEEICNAVYSTGFAILKSKDVSHLSHKMIYFQFMYSKKMMSQMIAAMPKGSYPSINKDNIENFVILTDIPNEYKVLQELNDIEQRLIFARQSVENANNRKQAILDKYLN